MVVFIDMDIIRIINEEVSKYDQILRLKAWHKEMSDKIDKETDYKRWKLLTDRQNRLYLNKMNELTKGGDDIYELGGDMKSRYIYHYTDDSSLLNILKDEVMITGNIGISFSSNSNLYKRGFVFWYPSKYSKGRYAGNTGIKMKFDFDKMKGDGLKFKRGSEGIGTHSGENEILYLGDEIDNISKYLIEIIIFRDKIDGDNLDEIVKEVDRLGIRYKIV